MPANWPISLLALTCSFSVTPSGSNGLWTSAMISDPDIFRAAQLLVDGRGEYAAPLANFRGEELRIRGYAEASELWRQVVAAIDELQRGRRGDEPLN